MRAVITIPTTEGGTPRTPCLPLVQVLDRAFLQHVIEALASRGVRDIQIIVGSRAGEIEESIKDGTRWGCRLSWHLTRDPSRPVKALATLLAGGGRLLIGRADCLPEFPDELSHLQPGYFELHDSWTGWAIVDAADVDTADMDGEVHIGQFLPFLATADSKRYAVRRVLFFHSLADLPTIQRAALSPDRFALYRAGREVPQGVWVCRNTSIAATARLVPPVFIGANTVIGAGAIVGPYSVIGEDCLLDSECEVRNTTVMPSSYVGSAVRLNGMIADGRYVVHPARGISICVESHILDTLQPAQPIAITVGWLTRVLAGLVFAFSLPLLAVIALWLWMTREGKVLCPRHHATEAGGIPSRNGRQVRTYVLAPPATGANGTGWVIPATLRGLVLEFLPGLYAVAMGRLKLVGLPPRDDDSLKVVVSMNWPVVASATMGLVTEAALTGNPEDSLENVLVTDAYQACTATRFTNVKRLIRFIGRSVVNWKGSTATELSRQETNKVSYPIVNATRVAIDTLLETKAASAKPRLA